MNVERIKPINPEELARPSGFSHAVSAPAGRAVYLAGQIGVDRDRNVVGGGIVAQFEQALGNLLIALAAAGGRPEGPGQPDHLPHCRSCVAAKTTPKYGKKPGGNMRLHCMTRTQRCPMITADQRRIRGALAGRRHYHCDQQHYQRGPFEQHRTHIFQCVVGMKTSKDLVNGP